MSTESSTSSTSITTRKKEEGEEKELLKNLRIVRAPSTPEAREKIFNFHIPNHISETCKNEQEEKIQTSLIPQDFPELLKDEIFARGQYWIALLDDELAGCVGITPINNNIVKEEEEEEEENKKEEEEKKQKTALVFSFHSFSVSPKHRHQGIGQCLMETALEAARSQGGEKITLFTIDRMESAVRLYKRFGFEITEATKSTTSYTCVDLTMTATL